MNDINNNVELAERKLRKHRAIVVQSHPFFGALLLKQQLVPTRDCDTCATNGKQFFFNPEFVLDQRPEHLQFVIAHEALHPGLGHHARRGNRRPDWWNEACDYAINGILVQYGFHVPDGALLRDDLTGKSAEQAYKILEGERAGQDDPAPAPYPQPQPLSDDSGDDQDQDDQDQQQDGGDQQGDDSDASQDADGDQDGDEGQGSGQGDQDAEGDPDAAGGESGDAGDQDGNGAGSQGRVPDFGGTGAILDAPVETEAEMAAEENEWKIAAVQAANLQASQAGDLPGDLARQLAEITEPKADWRDLLRRYMDQFAQQDYSWSKGNRRFLGAGQYLPSLQSESLPPVLFVVDTSGSIPDKQLAAAVSELESILEDLNPEHIDVICHDTRVTCEYRFQPGDDLDFDALGGGGTAFAPVTQWIADSDEQYALVIWFTDLCVGDWDRCIEPEAPVLWIDWLGIEATQPTFGDEVINLDDD